MWLPLASLLFACSSNPKDPDPVDTSLPRTGTTALQFYGDVPKNVLFLSIDTFRKDNLGTYGNRKGLTPFLDTLATQSVVMDDHLQCSCWTFGSTTCTLAGRSNIERGHIPRLNGDETNRPKVPAGTPFLATWLGEAGYYSVLVSANDWLSTNWGNAQGYDEVLKPGGPATVVHQTGVNALKKAIDDGKADKWFLHLHFMEPHASYDPPEEFVHGLEGVEPWPEDLTDRDTHYANRGEWPQMTEEERELLKTHLWALYEGEIRYLDDELSRVWDELDEDGLLDDTLVVVWNDHGEAFWEHGYQTHAFNLVSEENDGALMFWARNIVPGRYAGPTTAIDLVPTVLDLMEVPIPAEVTGYPIGSAPDHRPRYAEALARTGGQNAVTRDGLKMIFFWGGRVSVFDRRVDPLETTDLFDPENPEHLELWALVKAQALAMAPLVVGGNPAPIFPPGLP